MPESPLTQRDVFNLRDAIVRLEHRLDGLAATLENTYVRKDVLEPRLGEVEKNQAEVHARWEWAVRIIGAAIIVALLGLVLVSPGGMTK